MEFDPSLRDVPPSRHAVESDSEGSDDEQSGVRAEAPAQTTQPDFAWQCMNTESFVSTKGQEILILVGNGGEAFAHAVEVSLDWHTTASLVEDHQQQQGGQVQGAIAHSKAGSIVLLRPEASLTIQQSNLTHLSRYLLSTLSPKQLTIVDEYYPALYMASTPMQGVEWPIRSLITSKEAGTAQHRTAGVEEYEAPNYVTGLAAALLTEASARQIPAQLLLLPQNKSINPHLQTLQRVPMASASLTETPPPLQDGLADRLAQALHLDASSTWRGSAEKGADTSLTAFLHQRRSRQRQEQKTQISAMYM